MKFFRIAAEKDGLLIANDDGDHHAEDQDQEEQNIARSRISRRNKLKSTLLLKKRYKDQYFKNKNHQSKNNLQLHLQLKLLLFEKPTNTPKGTTRKKRERRNSKRLPPSSPQNLSDDAENAESERERRKGEFFLIIMKRNAFFFSFFLLPRELSKNKKSSIVR